MVAHRGTTRSVLVRAKKKTWIVWSGIHWRIVLELKLRGTRDLHRWIVKRSILVGVWSKSLRVVGKNWIICGVSQTLLAIMRLYSSEIDINFFNHLDTSIVMNLFLNRLIGSHLYELLMLNSSLILSIFCYLVTGFSLSIWWGWHQLWQEYLIFLIGLGRFIFLFIEFIWNELKEVILGYILELIRASGALYEPLEYLFKGILSTLLISYVIAECWLLVELGKWIGSLLKTDFETIKVSVGAIHSGLALGLVSLKVGIMREWSYRLVTIRSLWCLIHRVDAA